MLISQETPWTIEKWHVRSSFRRGGFWVPDDAITMPEREISGPNMELEKKVFLVTVTVGTQLFYSKLKINMLNQNGLDRLTNRRLLLFGV